MLTPLLFVVPFLGCFLPTINAFDFDGVGERCFLPMDNVFCVEIEGIGAVERCFLPI